MPEAHVVAIIAAILQATDKVGAQIFYASVRDMHGDAEWTYDTYADSVQMAREIINAAERGVEQ